MSAPTQSEKKSLSPARLLIFSLGAVAIVLGGLRGSRVVREWWELRQQRLFTDRFANGIHGFYHELATDSEYSHILISLKPDSNTGQSISLELKNCDGQWIDARQAVDSGEAPDGYELQNDDEKRKASWVAKNDTDGYVMVVMTSIDGEWYKASILCLERPASEKYGPCRWRIDGREVAFPCSRSALSALFGAPQVIDTLY